MPTIDLQKRIDEIDREMSNLESERADLEEQAVVVNKWSSIAIQQRLRDMVAKKFGSNHNIKVAIFKANGEYNDQGYNYHSPVLVLIDADYNEVDHMLNLDGYLVPEDRDQFAYYEAMNEDLFIDDFTMKF